MYFGKQGYVGTYNQITVVANFKRIATDRVFPIMHGVVNYFFPEEGGGSDVSGGNRNLLME